MNIKEAMRLFNIITTDDINKDNIKRTWKRIMVKVHPDAGGSHETATKYNQAYNVLKEYAEKIEEYKKLYAKSKVDICLLGLNELLSIYDGKTLVSSINSDSGIQESFLSKDNLLTKRVILDIPVKVVFNGMHKQFNCVVVHDIKDEYNVVVHVDDVDVLQEAQIKIEVFGKVINTTMTTSKMQFIFRLPHNILINVQVERIERNGQKDN